MPAPPVGPGDPQAHAHMRGGGQVHNRLHRQPADKSSAPVAGVCSIAYLNPHRRGRYRTV
ncbi:hypothetical protein BC826DRAFT_1030475 [Russula brevipes]|nr:hypothetical protein BC826DRAFT_1030475 [Russula brevipes]